MDNKELFGETFENEKSYEETAAPGEALPQQSDLTSEQIQQQVQEESKKGNNGVAVAVVTLLFILVIGLCVYIAVSVSKMVPQSGQEDKEYEAQTADPWEEILGDDYIDGADEQEDSSVAPDAEEGMTSDEFPEEETDAALEHYYSEEHKYQNHAKEDFAGPYYQEVTDCIDENVSYEVKRKFYDYMLEEKDVFICTSYIELEGDIPGVEEINALLEENATYFAKNFEKNNYEILQSLEGTGTGIHATIKSYVTYNTENMISVVVYEDIEMGYMYHDVALRCYNINLDTGTILDNHTILSLGEGFGQEFRDRSNKQNGISEGGIEPYSNEQIEAMLTDDTSLILFYTPLGIELGYNYRGDYYTGWITITMQDYEKYISLL